MPPHPDRRAATLAQCANLAERSGPGPFQPPGPGSADARIDLKLLAYEANRALTRRGTEAAVRRIADLRGPDLWAGTIQDGTARGFMVALEEAIDLCEPPAEEPDLDRDADRVFEGKVLRRKRDILIASAGARIRFGRRTGVLLVDRDRGLHTENCIRFEDRRDTGHLDSFCPADGERPRIFSPAFLQPVSLCQGELRDNLILEGSLGRGPTGYPCRVTLEGRKDERCIRLTVAIDNRHPDHRLRIRFLGFPDPAYIAHHCTAVWSTVREKGRGFLAATLVRACGRLLVGEDFVPTPAAQCRGWIEHRFTLGSG